jgi:hypothetical protein
MMNVRPIRQVGLLLLLSLLLVAQTSNVLAQQDPQKEKPKTGTKTIQAWVLPKKSYDTIAAAPPFGNGENTEAKWMKGSLTITGKVADDKAFSIELNQGGLSIEVKYIAAIVLSADPKKGFVTYLSDDGNLLTVAGDVPEFTFKYNKDGSSLKYPLLPGNMKAILLKPFPKVQ